MFMSRKRSDQSVDARGILSGSNCRISANAEYLVAVADTVSNDTGPPSRINFYNAA